MRRKLTTNRVILIFTIFGMTLSGWMWSFKLSNEVPACTLSGCEHVMTGDYSVMLGVPVAALGFFYYGVLGLLAFQRELIESKWLNGQLAVFIILGMIFTIYLRYLEFVKIGDWCQWCWVSVFFMIVITGSYLLEIKQGRGIKSKS